MEELPKAIVWLLLKDKLARVTVAGAGEGVMNKDTMAAFTESARIFIHCLSTTLVDAKTATGGLVVWTQMTSLGDCTQMRL